ncbi:MAG: ABC transporter ATP-binding protein [Angelakisella sp.]
MLIDIRNVSKIYNEGKESEVRALDDITLTIDNGEFTAILGQSGSGKSTLMNILGCLDIPTYGEYILGGEAVNEMPLKKLSDIRNHQIGFIFQGFNLISNLTAIENVELPLIYRGMSRGERTRLCVDALEQVGLAGRVKHKPSQLSGGQQQRVAIARAIAASPPIIMADEPTGNLDTKSSFEVMSKLASLNDAGASVILITHDMHLMLEHTRRTLVLKEGKIIADEAPATVLSTADLVASASLRETSLYRLAKNNHLTDATGFVSAFIQHEEAPYGGL